jgi:hypothetical protein
MGVDEVQQPSLVRPAWLGSSASRRGPVPTGRTRRGRPLDVSARRTPAAAHMPYFVRERGRQPMQRSRRAAPGRHADADADAGADVVVTGARSCPATTPQALSLGGGEAPGARRVRPRAGPQRPPVERRGGRAGGARESRCVHASSCAFPYMHDAYDEVHPTMFILWLQLCTLRPET